MRARAPAALLHTELPLPTPRPVEARFTALDFKSIADDGRFEGYASLFNHPDLGNDVVLPGAFRDTLARRGARGVRMLFQHNPAEPIGTWDVIREDHKGLFVQGRLATGVARAREVLALMRSGAIDGLSIGFKAIKAHRDRAAGIRKLAQIDLWEISIVTFPMLPEARIFAVAPQLRAQPPRKSKDPIADITAAAHRMHARLDHCARGAKDNRSLTSTALAASIAGERVMLSLLRLSLLEHKFHTQKANFNPGQIRDSIGRWAGDGGNSHQPAQSKKPKITPKPKTAEQQKLEDILKPGGQELGIRTPGAARDIRTVTPSEFEQLRKKLLEGAKEVPAAVDYPGKWYQRSDGTIVGERGSSASGPTLEIIEGRGSGLKNGYKVHEK